MRILVAGQLVEDIDQYNRIHEMMSFFVAPDSRTNDAAEAFGGYEEKHNYAGYTVANYQGIGWGESLTVLFTPLSGLLMQSKMIPLRYAPVTIELELVDSYTDPVFTGYTINPRDAAVALTGADISVGLSAIQWQIMNVQVKTDVCVLDNALDNSYAQHLLSGKSLPISYNTFVSQLQTIANQSSPLINVSRALTRLKTVFVTLQKDYTVANNRNNLLGRKTWNEFYSPMSIYNADGTYSNVSEGEFEAQLQIGSKLFPEYPIRSHNECYYQLKKTLGVQASSVHNFNINPIEYRDYKFIWATDCEKVLDAAFTGINTRAGDLMSIRFEFQNKSINGQNFVGARFHIVSHSDQIMEIRDSGVQVLD